MAWRRIDEVLAGDFERLGIEAEALAGIEATAALPPALIQRGQDRANWNWGKDRTANRPAKCDREENVKPGKKGARLTLRVVNGRCKPTHSPRVAPLGVGFHLRLVCVDGHQLTRSGAR